MNEYEHAGNLDRLYKDEADLLTEEGFDNQIAGIRLLGRDMATIVDKKIAREVRSILEYETKDSQKLIIDIIRERKMFNDKFDTIFHQLEKLKQGFIEVLERGL